MSNAIGTVLFLILVAACLALSIYARLPDRRPAPRFDIATARRESHVLGLPFPESDGTLSLPPEPEPLPVGEPRFVIDRVRSPRELPDPVWVDRAHREGWACATHGPDCDLRTQWCRLVASGWRRVPSERELEIAYEALYGKGQDLR